MSVSNGKRYAVEPACRVIKAEVCVCVRHHWLCRGDGGAVVSPFIRWRCEKSCCEHPALLLLKACFRIFFDESFYSIKYHFIVSRVGRTFMQSFFWMFYENRLIPQGWVATAGLHAWCYLCCHMISRTRVNSLKKCVWVCVLVGGNIQSAPPCQATLSRSVSDHASTWNKSIIFHF